MKILSFLCGFVIAVFLCGCCNVVLQHHPSEQIIKTSVPTLPYKSVVKLQANSIDGSGDLIATGFAIDQQTIVTVAHFCAAIVEGPLLAFIDPNMDMIYLNNNHELAKMDGLEIEAIDEDFDLCLIKKEKHGRLPVKLIENYDSIDIGDRVRIIGAPLGWFPVDTEGKVITPMSDFKSFFKIDKRLVISAPCAPGNSGSPVFNERGEVIGVVIAKANKYNHLSIATTTIMLERFLKYNGK